MRPSSPPAAQPDGIEPLEQDDFHRWYGVWDPLGPATIGAFMAGFDRPWCITGGWSLEAFTGISRPHGDFAVSILLEDVTWVAPTGCATRARR